MIEVEYFPLKQTCFHDAQIDTGSRLYMHHVNIFGPSILYRKFLFKYVYV